MNNAKIKLWRYILAAIILILGPMVVEVLARIFLSLSDLFAPQLYKMGTEWISFVSQLTGIYVSVSLSIKVLKESKYIFISVFCLLWGFFWGLTAYLLFINSAVLRGINDTIMALIYIITAIYFIFVYKAEKNEKAISIEEQLINIARTSSYIKDLEGYAKYLCENSSNSITPEIAKAFMGIVAINNKQGKEAALKAFDEFILFEIDKIASVNAMYTVTAAAFLCGLLFSNEVVTKEESDALSNQYFEVAFSKSNSLKKNN